VKQWRPYDAVVFKLQDEIDKIISQEEPGSPIQERLKVYLRGFLESISTRLERMAERAIPLVEPKDVLFLYGYSLSIAGFLEAIKRGQTVYVVDSRASTAHLQFEPYEDEQMLAFLKQNGFDDHYIKLNELSKVLNDLHRTKTPCKIVLGTHSVVRMDNGDHYLLCKKGSRGLCLIGRDGGAQIMAFAETNKFTDLKKEEEIERVLAQGFSYVQMVGNARVAGEAERATTRMETITRSLIDHLVTENGIYGG
jgi:translation initiation factor 2B subunit (eIF-2B alpha/beta/delta family)